MLALRVFALVVAGVVGGGGGAVLVAIGGWQHWLCGVVALAAIASSGALKRGGRAVALVQCWR